MKAMPPADTPEHSPSAYAQASMQRMGFKAETTEALLALFPGPELSLKTHDITAQLEQALSPELLSVFKSWHPLLQSAPCAVFLIGGLPRDILRYQPGDPQLGLGVDIDLCVEGEAQTLAHWLLEQNAGFQWQSDYPAFGTVKLTYTSPNLPKALTLELASTRLEHYNTVGALPFVQQLGVPLSVDCLRRDFTANTLALSLQTWGQLLDFNNGLSALQQGQLQALQASTFLEDPSRLLRGFKFATRFQWQWPPQTAQLAQASLAVLPQTSYTGGGSRIRAELQEWWQLPSSAAKLQLMTQWLDWQGWRALHPKAFDTIDTTPVSQAWQHWLGLSSSPSQLSSKLASTLNWLGLLSAFWQACSDKQQKVLAQALELNRHEQQVLALLQSLSSKPIKRWVDEADVELLPVFAKALELPEAFQSLFPWLTLAPKASQAEDWIAAVERWQILSQRAQQARPTVSGSQVQAQLQLQPGPKVGQALKALQLAKWHALTSPVSLPHALVPAFNELEWLEQWVHSTGECSI
jgi:tRNA nucleotidyltransferase/poly(A) polymerase